MVLSRQWDYGEILFNSPIPTFRHKHLKNLKCDVLSISTDSLKTLMIQTATV